MSKQATPKQARFAELVLGGAQPSDAYRQAYDCKRATDKTIWECASKLMRHPKVAAIVAQGRKEIVTRIAMDQADLVRIWTETIATDRNELAQIRRVCCRYCYGVGFRYQETPAQREARFRQHQMLLAATPEKDWARLPQFDEMGGIGYDRRKPPNPECIECFGDGEEHVYLADTRHLSDKARGLFEGIDIKNGAVVVKMKDRGAAEERLAKHLGMFIETRRNLNLNANIGGPGGAPVDPVEASKVYQDILSGDD